jgi:carbonic anhydrase
MALEPIALERRKASMETVDYIYRYDPRKSSLKISPADVPAAKKALEDGNRMFSRFMHSCRTVNISPDEPRYVVHCNGPEVGIIPEERQYTKQAPFAVIVGCSDARVPTEMLFGQGFNDVFVIRVAGNVMGDVCIGSVDFALTSLIESVKVVVVLGHSGCGAVTAAVDSYMEPVKFRSKLSTPSLRAIQERIFVAVREAANGLREVWGPDASTSAGYRTALTESAVAINAAQAAFDLRQEAERMGRSQVEILFGVFDLHTYQVSIPVIPDVKVADESVQLAYAPTNPEAFRALAHQLANLYKEKYYHPGTLT